MSEKKKKSSKIGLTNTYIAIFDPEKNKYHKPERLTTIKEMSVTVNMSENNEYNDNGLFEVLDSFDNFEVELSYTDLTPGEQAMLLGWNSIGAVRLSGADDNPPWIALMGERNKRDGSKRYFKYFKGKARQDSEDAASKGGSIEAQPDTIKITFGVLPDDFPVTEYRNVAKALVDEADPLYDDEGKDWFDEVIAGRTIEDEEELDD